MSAYVSGLGTASFPRKLSQNVTGDIIVDQISRPECHPTNIKMTAKDLSGTEHGLEVIF
ncbi:hypothetical protein HGRIS_010673 [Hohenbuehelia grisea]|uniref:Uncharacterized protein n=1 Tax=Hohenbuehelia grisea TaxID=104357 RepID=A0ABR3IXE8_9AGAR